MARRDQGRFSFVGERLCLDFVNTRVMVNGQLTDLLQDFHDWVEWSFQAKVLNSGQAGEAVRRWKGSGKADKAFNAAKAFRESLRGALERIAAAKKAPETIVREINALLRQPIGYSTLVHSGQGLEMRRQFLVAEPIHMLGPVAESAADLFSHEDRSFIKKCDNPACAFYFYDTTKNHARRWCSMNRCGNRMKVAAFYRRRRKAQTDTKRRPVGDVKLRRQMAIARLDPLSHLENRPQLKRGP